MGRIIFNILFIGFLCQTGWAQDFDKAKLDNYFNALETHNKFMGSVAVSRDGHIIYSKSTGFLDVENGIKADRQSKYRIGSISKTFTTVLVMKALENNMLDLNQTIDIYFKTIKHADKITVKHLLYHRSGIHNFTNDKEYLSWHTQPKTEKEMVAIIAEGGSDFEPDSKAQYSNSNFVLLTFILEKTFKKPYGELLNTYIIQPLGLKNTYYGKKINPSEKECKSYKYLESWKLEPETDMSIPLGAGGVVSTPEDLVRFSDALFGGKLLKKHSLEMMQTFQDHYGAGLFQAPFYDKIGHGHNGGIDGFSSLLYHFSDGNISYALISNGVNTNINNISIAVLSAVYNKPYDIPEFSSFKVNPEDLDKYTGTYASTQIPLKITVTKQKHLLMAQATGQPSFPLEPSEKDVFTFDQSGLTLKFNVAENTMLLIQHGAEYLFTKEKANP